MKRSLLFVHGAGPQGPGRGSGGLIGSLRVSLGDRFELLAPRMPEPESPVYAHWREYLARELSRISGTVILVGHSLGGSVILKYLAEAGPGPAIAGVFLVAAPCWGADEGWSAEEYMVPERLAAELARRTPIFLYHSRSDAVVPFSHLEAYAAMLPDATIRIPDGGDHFFANGLAELVADIELLSW